MSKILLTSLALLLCPLTAEAQRGAEVFFGPRFGAGMGIVTAEEGGSPVMTQLGVQADAHWDTGASMDFVLGGQVLMGGIEYGAIFPSVAVLTGLATKSGFQATVGPHLSVDPQPLGLALSLGQELEVGDGKLPIEVLVVPRANSVTVTALIGYYFSTRHW